MKLAEELLAQAATAPDPRALIEAARALLAQANNPRATRQMEIEG